MPVVGSVGAFGGVSARSAFIVATSRPSALATSLASHERRSVSVSPAVGPSAAFLTASAGVVPVSTPSTPDVHGVAIGRLPSPATYGADRQIGVPSFLVADTCNQNWRA